MLLYSYRIGGVDYESSQDITDMRGVVDVAQVRAGFPCSARYLPGNPQNSIVVAEEWTGLRQGLPVLPAYEDRDPHRYKPSGQLAPRPRLNGRLRSRWHLTEPRNAIELKSGASPHDALPAAPAVACSRRPARPRRAGGQPAAGRLSSDRRDPTPRHGRFWLRSFVFWGMVETARCLDRRWSLYHAGVLILLYSELMILVMVLFLWVYL